MEAVYTVVSASPFKGFLFPSVQRGFWPVRAGRQAAAGGDPFASL